MTNTRKRQERFVRGELLLADEVEVACRDLIGRGVYPSVWHLVDLCPGHGTRQLLRARDSLEKSGRLCIPEGLRRAGRGERPRSEHAPREGLHPVHHQALILDGIRRERQAKIDRGEQPIGRTRLGFMGVTL